MVKSCHRVHIYFVLSTCTTFHQKEQMYTKLDIVEIMIIYDSNDFEYLVLVNLDNFKIHLCVYIKFKWFLPF